MRQNTDINKTLIKKIIPIALLAVLSLLFVGSLAVIGNAYSVINNTTETTIKVNNARNN